MDIKELRQSILESSSEKVITKLLKSRKIGDIVLQEYGMDSVREFKIVDKTETTLKCVRVDFPKSLPVEFNIADGLVKDQPKNFGLLPYTLEEYNKEKEDRQEKIACMHLTAAIVQKMHRIFLTREQLMKINDIIVGKEK